jgi:hypothetical protein
VLFPRYSFAFSQRFSNAHAAGQMLYSNLKTHPACLHKDRHSVIFFLWSTIFTLMFIKRLTRNTKILKPSVILLLFLLFPPLLARLKLTRQSL